MKKTAFWQMIYLVENTHRSTCCLLGSSVVATLQELPHSLPSGLWFHFMVSENMPQFSFSCLWNSLSSCQEVVFPGFIHSQLMWCVWGNDLSIETLYYLIFTPQDIPYRTDHSTQVRDKTSQHTFPTEADNTLWQFPILFC